MSLRIYRLFGSDYRIYDDEKRTSLVCSKKEYESFFRLLLGKPSETDLDSFLESNDLTRVFARDDLNILLEKFLQSFPDHDLDKISFCECFHDDFSISSGFKDNPNLFSKLSIGYNGSKDFYDEVVVPFKKYISSVYMVPPNHPTSRNMLNVDIDEVIALRKKLKSDGILVNLVFNSDFVPPTKEHYSEMILLAKKIDPDQITVSNINALELFKMNLGYPINLSVIFDINTIDKLDAVIEAGEGRIVSYNIGRKRSFDVDFIRKVRLRYPDLLLKHLVNEGCLFDCPDQNFHSSTHSFYSITGISPKTNNYFFCSRFNESDHWRFLAGQYIPPKFLRNFYSLVDEFKISTRSNTNSQIIGLMMQYITEEDILIGSAMYSSHGGNLFAGKYPTLNSENRNLLHRIYDFSYPEDFFEMRSKCNHICKDCGYCKRILERKII